MENKLKTKRSHNTLSRGYKEYAYFGSTNVGFVSSRNRYVYKIEGVEGEVYLGKQLTLNQFILNLSVIHNTNLDNIVESKHKEFFKIIKPFAKSVYNKYFSSYAEWTMFKNSLNVIYY